MSEEACFNVSCKARFLGHCFAPLLALFSLMTGILLISIVNEGPFFTANLPNILDSDIPEVIFHHSDPHNTPAHEERVNHNTELMQFASEYINPGIVIITGDVADGTETKNMISFHRPFEDNWEAFNRTLVNSGISRDDRLLIVIAGNHDVMAVHEDTNESFPYRRLYMNPDDDFIVKKIKRGNINFILFHPVRFPMVSGPIGVFPYVYEDMLDKLEDAIEKNMTNIIVTHNPPYMLWSGRNKRGHNIADIIHMATGIMSGHVHPYKPVFYRDGNTISLSGSPCTFTTTPSIITVDGGMISGRSIDVTKSEHVLITYPIPKMQVTGQVDFSKTEFDIRSVVLSNNRKNLTVYIDDQKYGNLEYVSVIRENQSLYKLHVNVSEGDHKLQIKGDLETEMEFFVGKEAPSSTHIGSTDTSFGFMIALGIIPYILVVLRLIPLWKIPSVKKATQLYKRALDGSNVDYSVSKMIYMGPLWFITRLQYAPKTIYWILVALTAWYWVLPIYLSPTNGEPIGIVFAWGMYLEGDLRFDAMHFVIDFFYAAFFLMPLISLVGLKYEPVVVWWEIIFHFLAIAAAYAFWVMYAIVSGDLFTLYTAPMTYIAVPLSVAVIVLMFVLKERTSSEDTADSLERFIIEDENY